MSNTYSWKIDALKCAQEPQPDYVAVVEWTVTGTDGNHTAMMHGSSIFNPNAPGAGEKTYIPCAQLTEEIVMGWVKGNEAVAEIEATLDNQLSNLANPPVAPQAVDLPWVSA